MICGFISLWTNTRFVPILTRAVLQTQTTQYCRAVLLMTMRRIIEPFESFDTESFCVILHEVFVIEPFYCFIVFEATRGIRMQNPIYLSLSLMHLNIVHSPTAFYRFHQKTSYKLGRIFVIKALAGNRAANWIQLQSMSLPGGVLSIIPTTFTEI